MSKSFSELTAQFENGQIDPESFGHEEHLRVAFEMLQKYGFMEAVSKYAHGINSMAVHAEAPEKFNVTITLAFLSLISERIHHSGEREFEKFLKQNQDLLSRSLLTEWYSNEQLGSEFARTHFLLPKKAA